MARNEELVDHIVNAFNLVEKTEPSWIINYLVDNLEVTVRNIIKDVVPNRKIQVEVLGKIEKVLVIPAVKLNTVEKKVVNKDILKDENLKVIKVRTVFGVPVPGSIRFVCWKI